METPWVSSQSAISFKMSSLGFIPTFYRFLCEVELMETIIPKTTQPTMGGSIASFVKWN
jgi:hypothetical protein